MKLCSSSWCSWNKTNSVIFVKWKYVVDGVNVVETRHKWNCVVQKMKLCSQRSLCSWNKIYYVNFTKWNWVVDGVNEIM